MPSQQIEALETITALKRKLKREKDASTVPLAPFATNRGNKLRAGARYVHAGSLPWRQGGSGFKERVEHAGYQRYILERNPVRVDEYGDEVGEEDWLAAAAAGGGGADVGIENENPYGDVKLEELLRPLVHPSELLQHPAIAQIYKDPALLNMVRLTETQLREERNNLWNAKNLYQQFTGDEPWIPCEKVEAAHDWDLFGPYPGHTLTQQSRKRKLNGDGVPEINGVDQIDHAGEQTDVNGVDASGEQDEKQTDDLPPSRINGVHEHENGIDHALSDTVMDTDTAEPNQDGHVTDNEPSREQEQEQEQKQKQEQEHDHNSQADVEAGAEGEAEAEVEAEDDSRSSTPPPPRRITRALAAGNNTSTAPTPPHSPSPSTPTTSASPTSLQPHPLFLLPPALTLAHQPHPSTLPLSTAHSGLPPDELLETRKLLGIYIQKSEETIRALARILAKLTKAKTRRDRLVEWCVAEAHVGELSDGEDWVDEEKWGVKGELRKGRDEDEANGANSAGGAGGGAANGTGGIGNGDGGEDGPVAIGGRKGKRRRGARE